MILLATLIAAALVIVAVLAHLWRNYSSRGGTSQGDPGHFGDGASSWMASDSSSCSDTSSDSGSCDGGGSDGGGGGD